MKRSLPSVFTIVLILISIVAQAGLKVGDKAPDFTLSNPAGEKINLYSIIKPGKIVLLDFWASWCGPCREANKGLINVYNTFHPQGFEVFSVSLDKKKENWLRALEADKLVWPNHGSDFKEWESMSALLYQIEHLPSSFLLDENGIILAMELDEYDLEKKLNHIFVEQVNFFPQTPGPKLYFNTKAKFEIIDGQGKTILKGKAEEVDMTGVPEGTYKIKYEDREGTFAKVNGPGSVTFFPERAEDILTFSQESNFEILSVRGRLIKKGKAVQIDVKDLSSGPYYLSIEGNMFKFLKK